MTSTAGLGQLVQINVNPRGGVPKHAVPSARLTHARVQGDKQRNRRVHGGPHRAVCLYALELIEALQAEGHPITAGMVGENLTIAGLDWSALRPGVQLRVGPEVELEITSYTAPCQNIALAFSDGEFVRISHKLHPGWSRLYARVLREGVVHAGDAVELTGSAGQPDADPDSRGQ